MFWNVVNWADVQQSFAAARSKTSGLVNLSGLLLGGLEVPIGKNAEQILQAIAFTLARQ